MTGPAHAPGAAGRLLEAWRGRGPLARLLWLPSLLYRLLWSLRRAAYRGGLLPSLRLPVPVLVVGNVVAGGAGKTPTLIALVQHLQGRGLAVGVISRGYGRTVPQGDDGLGMAVSGEADPQAVGDEPLLIHRRTGAPVFVGRDRVSAGRRLLAAHPEVRLLLCDDGLQHLRLARDIEVCVFDERGTGNGWLLPAGPLREPWPRPVDLLLHTGERPAFEGGWHARRLLAEAAVDGRGRSMSLASLAAGAQPVAALAGIARPQVFFDMLRARGLRLAETHALPDHAVMDATLPALATPLPLLCTEKDAAKLWRLRPDAWAVPLALCLPAGLLERLDRLVEARLSSESRAAPR